MSSSLPPVAPPESDPSTTAPPPQDDEISPVPQLVIPVQVPLPSSSPPKSDDTSTSPSPSLAFPPVLPVIVETPPTLPTIPSQTPLPPQPQPPTILPTPVTKDIPTPVFSPPDSKPVTVIQTPPRIPPVRVKHPKTRPKTAKPGPLRPSPLPTSQIPAVRDPKTRPEISKPGITDSSPETSRNIPAEKQTHSNSPLAASAVLPSQPPVSLPVPQTPHGEAWLPSSSVPPSILPSIPDTPAEVNAPPFSGEAGDNGSSSSSSSSTAAFLGPAGGNHQNVQGSVNSSGGGFNVLVVGLVVCGVLLVLFGAVFGLLIIFCRGKQKKSDGIESDRLHSFSFKGLEGKTSLPKYTKQSPNIPGYKLPADATTTSEVHKAKSKSDVYSYGVVLLELITGRPPIGNFGPATNGSLVNWARPLLLQAIADQNFDGLADSRLQSNYNVDEMDRMVSCAAACVRLSSWRRPRLSQVIRALEGNLSVSELDGGTKAGHSAMHFPYESLDFDARNYIDDMKRMALASSRYSDNTSDYGLNHSTSSNDSTHHIC